MLPVRRFLSTAQYSSHLVIAVSSAEAAERAFRAAHPFAPALTKPLPSSVAARVQHGHSVEELAADERGKRTRLRAAALAEQAFANAHPFQPKLVAKEPAPITSASQRHHANFGLGDDTTMAMAGDQTSHVEPAASLAHGPYRLAVRSDPAHVTERVQSMLAAKEAKLAAERQRLEYARLKECTFQPQTGHAHGHGHGEGASTHTSGGVGAGAAGNTAGGDGGVVVVRGLGRYLETKELARKLEEEKRCV